MSVVFEERPASAITELEAPWRALHQAHGGANLFVSHRWLSGWVAAFGTRDHRLFLEREGDRLLSAWVMRRKGEQLLPIGHHSYYPEILRLPDRSPRSLLASISSAGVRAITLPLRQEQSELLGRQLDELFEPIPIDENPFYVVDCSRPFDDYLAGRSGRVRRELHRKDRKLEAGFAKVELLRQIGRGDSLVEHIRNVDAHSWKAEAGTAIVSDDREMRFYERLAAIDEGELRSRSYVLMADGIPRTFLTGVDYRGCYYALKTSYRAEDASAAPGQVLFFRVLRELCAEASIDRVELLGSDARWKRELASETVVMKTFRLEASSVIAKARRLALGEVKPRLRSTLTNAREVMKDRPAVVGAIDRLQQVGRGLERMLDEEDS